MPPRNRAIVIASPHSGRSAYLEQALSLLQQQNVAITDVVSIGDLASLPVQGPVWKAQGLDIVIVAGGDGLVGGILTHIVASGLPLGILPLGTANDIARSLHIPQDIEQAVEVVTHGRPISVDIGVVQSVKQAPHQANRHPGISDQTQRASHQQSFFAQALTVGLHVQFARLATNIITRQRFGRLTYPIAALEALKRHEPIELDIEINGLAFPSRVESTRETQTNRVQRRILAEPVTFHGQMLQVSIVNAPIFGGQWQIELPQASISDHLLDVVIITDIKLETLGDSIKHFFSNLGIPIQPHSDWHAQNTAHPLLQQAELSGIQGVYHFQAQGVVISSRDAPQDIALDGEIRGQTPLRAHIAPQQVQVIVPDND